MCIRDRVWGYDETLVSPSRVRPAFNQPVTDPAYGTELRRITDASDTRFNRNTYSRRQAENADGSAVITYHGDAEYHVLRRSDLTLIAVLPISPNGEPQWHPTNPDLVRFIAGPNASTGELALYETSVSSGETREIANFADRVRAQLPDATYISDRG